MDVSETESLLITSERYLAVLKEFAVTLAARHREINDLNVFPVPDSDTGTNALLTIRAGLADTDELESLKSAGVDELSAFVALKCGMGAKGNSGVILAEYLRGQSIALSPRADAARWALALRSGASIARTAVLTPEDGTMLTVADAVADVEPGDSFGEYFVKIASAARAALVETQFLLPVLTEAGVVDAGAVVIALLHDAFVRVLADPLWPDLEIAKRQCAVDFDSYTGPEYEVMFLFEAPTPVKVELVEQLADCGDSLMVSGDTAPFNVHIHTDDPTRVLYLARTAGDVEQVAIAHLLGKDITDITWE